MLAAGSNAAPEQLSRKFGNRRKAIAVSVVTVQDYCVVYSAHFASYGSIPATLIPCQGALTHVCINWLDEADLATMHTTEALGVNYDYVDGTAIRVVDPTGQAISIHGYYQSRPGPLMINGAPVRLAMVASTGSTWPSLTQRSLLAWIGNALAPELAYHDFLDRIINDQDYRAACRNRLASLDTPRTR